MEKSIQTTSPTRSDGWNWDVAPIDWHPLAPNWGELVGSLDNWDDLENFRKLTDDEKDEIVRQALARLTPRKRARIEKALARQAKKFQKVLDLRREIQVK